MIWLLGSGVVLAVVIIGLFVNAPEDDEERRDRIIAEINRRDGY